MEIRTSWLDIEPDSDFSMYNFPFGVAQLGNDRKVAVSALGEYIIDLDSLQNHFFFDELDLPASIFRQGSLNDFIALGKPTTSAVRERLIELFTNTNTELRNDEEAMKDSVLAMKEVELVMPVYIPSYTDFYSSIEHATNIGSMIRDPENALMSNWKHIPVGYHGRSSSIIVSGEPVHRPKGQTKAPDAEKPTFGPTKRLDFELEMAFIVSKETNIGDSITTDEAEEHIFGFVLFNDWSARDIQVWEYVPLGPFLAKNFASSISPWIVTLEAFEDFRVAGPKQDPPVLPYLESSGDRNFDINLEVSIAPEGSTEEVVCKSNFKYMYWNICQQLAHHTVNGCNIEVGDMYASGTISGPTPDSYGSMMELAWKGTKPLKMADGSARTFIADGDTVIMRGYAEKDGKRIGFGEVSTKILPAK